MGNVMSAMLHYGKLYIAMDAYRSPDNGTSSSTKSTYQLCWSYRRFQISSQYAYSHKSTNRNFGARADLDVPKEEYRQSRKHEVGSNGDSLATISMWL